jgi:DNA-binding response OmpR family regulator
MTLSGFNDHVIKSDGFNVAIVENIINRYPNLEAMFLRYGINVIIFANAGLLFNDLSNSDIDLFIICEGDNSMDKFVLIRTLASLPNVPATLLYGMNSGYHSRVLALDLGLDRHLSSSIDALEILARSRSLLKRRSGVMHNLEYAKFLAGQSLEYKFSGLLFNADLLSITFLDGSYIMLSATEVRLLVHFIKHRGILQSRDKLYAVGAGGKISEKIRTIDVTISRLRKKLSYPDRQNVIIQTVHGRGYIFMPSVEIVSSSNGY